MNSTGHHKKRHCDGTGFSTFILHKDEIFLFGFALPILLLTLATLLWNPNSKSKEDSSFAKKTILKKVLQSKRGDVNVLKWTMIWFFVPLILIIVEGALGHPKRGLGENLKSPTGYAATWSLALFLIPVTKHSPILDWLRVTPVQALAFHRIAGWTSLCNSILHGTFELLFQMNEYNSQHTRS